MKNELRTPIKHSSGFAILRLGQDTSLRQHGGDDNDDIIRLD